MSPRKRREPPSPLSPRRSPKRLRAPPAPFNQSEDPFGAAARPGPACKSNSSSAYFSIKGILEERDGKYLIDWAPEIRFNTHFDPDWQPRKFLNAAALRLWETQRPKATAINSTDDETRSPPKTPIRARNPRLPKPPHLPPVTRSSAAGRSNGHSDTTEPQKRSRSTPSTQELVQPVSPSLDTSRFPDVAVQLSQREALDQHEYLTYQSSSSAQATQPSVDIRKQSKSEDTSPRAAIYKLDYSSNSEQTSTHANSNTQDWDPDGEQVSTYDPSVSSNWSPARATEHYSTIPDSQPIRHSPGRTEISINSSLSGQPLRHVGTSNGTSESHSRDIDQFDSSNGIESYQGRSSRGFKPWVIDDPSTQSQSAESTPQSGSTENHVLSQSNGNHLKSPVQVPGSFEASSRWTATPQRPRERIVIPQTQECVNNEIVQSIEQDPTSLNPKISPSIKPLSAGMENRQATTNTPPENGMSDQQHARPATSENLAEKVQRKLREASEQTEAKISAERERFSQYRSQRPTPSEISTFKHTDLEITTSRFNLSRSPRNVQSPSLIRTALSPKGPLSPPILRSPVEVRISTPSAVQSPLSVGSPAVIPERLPHKSQEAPSHLNVETSGLANDIQVSIQQIRSLNQQSQASEGPSSSQTTGEYQTMLVDICNTGPMEFIVPLSMPPRTQKQYIETYRFYRDHMSLFLTKRPDKQLVQHLNTLLDRVGKVTTHMDLDGGGPSSQDEVSIPEEASYAESCSEKFKLLGLILEATRDDGISIAIFATEGQLLDFLETYLRAKKYGYSRLDVAKKASPEDQISRSHVYLSPSRSGEVFIRPVPSSLVIAFDETFDINDPYVKSARNPVAENGHLSPVIHFVVFAALEHINFCLPTTLDPIDRLRRLVWCMLWAEKAVGQLGTPGFDFSDFSPTTYAQQIRDFLRAGSHPSDWHLPPIPPLENIPIMDSDSSLSEAMSDISDEYKPDGPLRYWPNPVPPKVEKKPTILSVKRPYVLEYGDSLETQAKKLRYGKAASQLRARGDFSNPPLEEDSLEERYKRMEIELKKSKELLKEYHEVFESRQALFEADRIMIGGLKSDVANLQSLLLKRTADFDAALAEVANLKAERSNIQTELRSLRTEITTSPHYAAMVPDLVTREQSHATSAALETENAAKTKKIKSLENDADFIRQQYQSISSTAAEQQSVMEAQDAEIKQLSRRADEVRIRLRELRDRDVNGALRKENARLKEMVRVRDRDNRELQAELKEARRGRQGVMTRGSSVQPGTSGMRSPRGGSRGVSPAVGFGGPGGVSGARGEVRGDGIGGVTMSRALSGLSQSQRFG